MEEGKEELRTTEEVIPEGILEFGDSELPEDTIVLDGTEPEDPEAEDPPVAEAAKPAADAPVFAGYTVFLEHSLDLAINGETLRLSAGAQGVSREVFEILKNAGLA